MPSRDSWLFSLQYQSTYRKQVTAANLMRTIYVGRHLPGIKMFNSSTVNWFTCYDLFSFSKNYYSSTGPICIPSEEMYRPIFVQYYKRCCFDFPHTNTETTKLHYAFIFMRHRQHYVGRSSKCLNELPRTAAESYINDCSPALHLTLAAYIDGQYNTWVHALGVSDKIELKLDWQRCKNVKYFQIMFLIGWWDYNGVNTVLDRVLT